MIYCLSPASAASVEIIKTGTIFTIPVYFNVLLNFFLSLHMIFEAN